MRSAASPAGDDAASSLDYPFLTSPRAAGESPPPSDGPSSSRWLNPDEQQQQQQQPDRNGSASVAAAPAAAVAIASAHLAGSSPAATLAPIRISLLSHDHAPHPHDPTGSRFAPAPTPSPVELEAAPAAGWLGGPRQAAHASSCSTGGTPQPRTSVAHADIEPLAGRHAGAADGSGFTDAPVDADSTGDGESSSSAQMAAAWSTLSRHPHLDASARAHIALLDLVMERVCERMLSLAPSEARSSDEEAETAAAAVNQALHRIGSSFCAAGERVVDLCLQQALAAESTVDTTSSRSSSTPAAVSAHSRSHGSASSVGTASDADDGEQAEGQPPARKKSKDASGSPKGVTQLDPSEPDCDSIAVLPAAGAAVADRKRVASPPGSARRSAGGRVKKEAASDEEGGEDEYQPRRKRKSRAKTKRPDDVSGKSSESRAANPEKQTGLLLSLLVASGCSFALLSRRHLF